jgi:hypothetical protein
VTRSTDDVAVRHAGARAAEPIGAFTYRSARSGALSAGLALAVGVESLVLHLWLGERHPGWAWTLTALGVATLAYVALEYRAWGRGAVHVTPDALDLRIAGRMAVRVPRTAVAGAAVASWRDVPDGASDGYLNGTGPAEPNVMLAFTAPVPVRVAAGLVTRRVRRLGLRVDDPAGFVAAVTGPPAR